VKKLCRESTLDAHSLIINIILYEIVRTNICNYELIRIHLYETIRIKL